LKRNQALAAQHIAANSPQTDKTFQKLTLAMEQNPIVAVPSQLQTITLRALPRSNQIDAPLFDECRNHCNGEHS
jgi:hypothetical protein